MERTPDLVVCRIALQSGQEAGYQFARELSEHQELSTIPVLLVADELSEDVIRRASTSGAKSVLPWPLTVDALRMRVSVYLIDKLATVSSKVLSLSSAAQFAAQFVGEDESQAPTESEQKIHLAQQLLARVLHNLKTSALLDVVDLEDVPQVLGEITKAICVDPRVITTALEQVRAGKVESSALESGAQAKPAEKPEKSVVLDLDSAFGLSKK